MAINRDTTTTHRQLAKQSNRVGFAILTFIGLGIVLPMVMLLQNKIDWISVATTTRYAVVAYSSIKISLLIADPKVRPTAGVFWIFVYICMAVVPLAQLATGFSTLLSMKITDLQLLQATGVILVGCIFFDLASRQKDSADTTSKNYKVRKLRSLATLRVFSLFAMAMASLFIVQVGGLQVFFSSREETSQALDQISPESGQAVRAMISASGSVTCLISLLFYIHMIRYRRKELNFQDIGLIMLLVAFNVVINNPMSNSRYWALAVIFGLFLPIVRHRKALFSGMLISGILLALFLFPLSDVSRRKAGYGSVEQFDSVWQMISVKDYDQYSMLTNTLGYTSDNGFSWGYQLIGAIFFWVPRVIWPGKPVDSGVEVGAWMNGVNLNLSSPFWAEGWINFGLLGVVIFMYCLGAVSRRLDSEFSRGFDGGFAVGYLGISVFVGYLFILLRGSLLQSMGRLFIIILSTIILTEVSKIVENEVLE